MPALSLNLSSDSLARLVHLRGKQVDIAGSDEVAAANHQVAIDLQNKIERYGSAQFKNPTGRLASSFRETTLAGGVEVGSDLPYARRREFGFSGMTDSLGRYYADDPGYFYVQRAISEEKDLIVQYYNVAMQDLFDKEFPTS